jgi:hypothetical protein
MLDVVTEDSIRNAMERVALDRDMFTSMCLVAQQEGAPRFSYRSVAEKIVADAQLSCVKDPEQQVHPSPRTP